MVRNYNRGSRKNKFWESAKELKDRAAALLEEQANEDTPEVNKEDIVQLLVDITVHLESLTKRAVPDIKGG